MTYPDQKLQSPQSLLMRAGFDIVTNLIISDAITTALHLLYEPESNLNSSDSPI